MSENELLDFVHAVSGDAHLAIEENLGEGFVRLKTAEAERRQAKHDIRQVEDIVIEMLRNSRDAHAKSIYVASNRDGDIKTLVFIDDGDGVPPDMQEAIFEPRVTSKLESMVMDTWGVHGRGMALYSISQNALEAKVASSNSQKGAALQVKIDLDELQERADQSSFPILAFDEEGKVHVASGPHNVLRMIVEFALELKDDIDVYFGSHAEIAATLVQKGRKQLSDMQLLFCDDIEELPVPLRLAAATDASELVSICEDLGLSISERTAHRILANQITTLTPPLTQALQTLRRTKPKAVDPDIYKDNRGLKIAKEDLDEFARALEGSFAALSRRYYIDLIDEPIIRVGKDAITVKFPFDKEM